MTRVPSVITLSLMTLERGDSNGCIEQCRLRAGPCEGDRTLAHIASAHQAFANVGYVLHAHCPHHFTLVHRAHFVDLNPHISCGGADLRMRSCLLL